MILYKYKKTKEKITMKRVEKILKMIDIIKPEDLKLEKKGKNYYYLEFETGNIFNRTLLKIHEDYSKDAIFFKDDKVTLIMDFKNRITKLKIKGHSFIEYQGNDFVPVLNTNSFFCTTFGEVIQKIYFKEVFKSDKVNKCFNYIDVDYDKSTVIIENRKENRKLLKILGKDTLEVTSGPHGFYAFSVPCEFGKYLNRTVGIFAPNEIQNYRSNMKKIKKLQGKHFKLKVSDNFIKHNMNSKKIRYRIKEMDVRKGDFVTLQSANGTIAGIIESAKNIGNSIRETEIRTFKDQIRI